MNVRFNENVTRFEFDDDDDRVDYSVRDRLRQEPRHLERLKKMSSVQDLLENACRRRPTTVVYGNLGRYPQLLLYYVDVAYGPDERIAIRVGGTTADDHPAADDNDERWGADYSDDGFSKCDALFWIEPDFDAVVERPTRAGHLIVLTSHPLLRVLDDQTLILGHRVGDNSREIRLPPLEGYVRAPDHHHRFAPDLFFERPLADVDEMLSREPAVCADLRLCKSPRDAYLKLLNASEVIRHYSAGNLRSWTAAIEDERPLLERIAEAKRILLSKWARIDCNVSGVNVLVAEYVDSFLIV